MGLRNIGLGSSDSPLSQLRAVIGSIASGVADDGSEPVKIGGVYRVTKPTFTDGMRGDIQVDQKGRIGVVLGQADGTANAGVSAQNDALSAATGGIVAIAEQYLWNGASFDRARTPVVFKQISNVAVVSGTPQTIWTPGAGKKFRLMGFMVSLSVAGFVIFEDSGVQMVRTGAMAAAVGLANSPMGNGILSALANNVLQIDVNANGNVNGFVFGTEE